MKKGIDEKGLIARLFGTASMPPVIGDAEERDISTPNFAKNIKTPKFPKIRVVSGNKVKANYLAWADYGTGHIDVAAFDEIMENSKGKMRRVYGHVRDALHRYIIGHEKHELVYTPQTHIEHGAIEARNMSILEHTDPGAYLAGLALHKKRLRNGDRVRRHSARPLRGITIFMLLLRSTARTWMKW